METVPAFLAVLAMVLAMLAISWAVRRSASTTLDFYLARRQIGPFLNASAICGDYLSAASFLGVAGAVYLSGLDGVWFATGFASGFLVVLLFLAAPLRRAGQFSIPDFLATRFSSQPVRMAAVAIVQIIVLIYLIPQMTGLGLTWQVLVGSGLLGMSPYTTGVIVATIAITGQAVVGGMRATTLNQALQFALLFVTVFLLAVIVVASGFSYPDAVARVSKKPMGVPVTVSRADLLGETVDGRPALQAVRSVMSRSGFDRVRTELAAGQKKIDVLVPARNRLHPDRPMRFSEPGHRYGLGEQVALLLTLLLGTAGLPHIVNRYFTSTSGRSARLSTVWVIGLAGTFYFLAVMLGVAARSELPEMVGQGATDATFVDGIVRVPEQALLVLAEELGGGALLGLVATAALAAIFSTMAGLLIAAAVSWGHDVYEQFINPYATERRRIVLGQVAVAGTAAAAAGIAVMLRGLQLPPSVALMVTWAFAVAGSAFTPIFLLAVWWKRMTAKGALAGMVVGSSLSIALIALDLSNRGLGLGTTTGLGNFPAILAAPAAAVAAMVVSRADKAWREPVTVWVRLHGTAMERRQALLARLTTPEAER